LHQIIHAALDALKRQGIEFHFSIQNIAEFWNVCTRPMERNGYGLTIAETNFLLEFIESTMTFLPDNEQVYVIWRRLVLSNGVRGVQVHDARLVAIMQAHGLTRILTLNQPDFQRYSEIQAVHPSQVLAASR
jgi:predicted nucleic acid-binding protein